MRRRRCVFVALAAALAAPWARAETLYVIDELVVSVSSTAGEAGERIAAIHSGDSVELLERHNAYAHVRLASGTQGWVKASYLSAALPLQRKLAAQLAELEHLRAEVVRLQDAAGAAALTARQLLADPPAPPPQGVRAVWPSALACATLALLAGFALGWRTLDRRIRRKYGGLRIY